MDIIQHEVERIIIGQTRQQDSGVWVRNIVIVSKDGTTEMTLFSDSDKKLQPIKGKNKNGFISFFERKLPTKGGQ